MGLLIPALGISPTLMAIINMLVAIKNSFEPSEASVLPIALHNLLVHMAPTWSL